MRGDSPAANFELKAFECLAGIFVLVFLAGELSSVPSSRDSSSNLNSLIENQREKY